MRRPAIETVLVAVVGTLLATSPVFAQTFSSGSTGADGALDVSRLSCFIRVQDNLSVCEVILPPSGILNYTTVLIPSGKTIIFRKNLQNTPVVLLAQGDVVVEGNLSVSAVPWSPDAPWDPALPGPGGFPGGAPPRSAGLGPGGGAVPTGGTSDPPAQGRWVGPLSLVPLVGGSGGASIVNTYGNSITGSGGAGAIVIASNGEIRIGGSGGIDASPYNRHCGIYGSGGAVRLVANRITMTGAIYAKGTAYCSGGATDGGDGIVRLEAPSGFLSFLGNSQPAPILSTVNPTIVAPAAPGLRIVSVGGFLVPDSAGSRKDAADLVLPKQLPDPINVLVEATNIPVGSVVTVSFGTSNQGTTAGVPLSGTLAQSTATIGVSGLNRNLLAYLYVQVLFAPPAAAAGAAPATESGRVTHVRMTTAPGEKPHFAFLRQDGAEIPANRLPATLQAWVSSSNSR